MSFKFVGLKFDRSPETNLCKKILTGERALFIYNENIENFYSESVQRGGGNACLRPYRADVPGRGRHPKKALGIPTGSLRNGGFRTLNAKAKEAIDDALVRIDSYIHRKKPETVYFSADATKKTLGTGIFQVGAPVKKYIVSGLRQIARKHSYEFIFR